MEIPEAEERGEYSRHLRQLHCTDCGGRWELWGQPMGVVLYARHAPGPTQPTPAFTYAFDSYRLNTEFKGNLGRIGTALRNSAHPLLPPKKRTGKQTRRG